MNSVRRSLNGVRCSVFCSDFRLFGERLFGVRRSAFGVQGVRCSAFCSALFLACCFVRCSVRKGLCAWSFARCCVPILRFVRRFVRHRVFCSLLFQVLFSVMIDQVCFGPFGWRLLSQRLLSFARLVLFGVLFGKACFVRRCVRTC